MLYLLISLLLFQSDPILIKQVAFLPSESNGILNFGMSGPVLLSKDAKRIIYADNSFGFIRVMDLNGKEIMRIGDRGRGPGEFQQIESMAQSEDGNRLYVLDYQNARIVSFNLQDGSYESTTIVKFPAYLITSLYVIDDEFILTGSLPENDAFFHRFKFNGQESGSFGSLFDFNKMPPGIILAKEQLTQGFLMSNGTEFVGISQAPYVRARYSKDLKTILSVSDPILPLPWTSHMRVTESEYWVGYYPRVSFASLIDQELIFASLLWPDDKKHIVQIVNSKSLKEEYQLNVDYHFVKDVRKVSQRSFHVLVIEPNTHDIILQEWTFEQ